MSPTQHTAFFQIDDWAVLEISGDDATTFLHGQFTNDLLALPEDKAQLSAYCVPKGSMIANFLIWRMNRGQYRMVLPSGLAEPVLQRLQMFKLRSHVEITSLTDTLALFGITEALELPAALPQSPLGKTESGHYTVIAWPGACARWLLACPRDAANDLWATIGPPAQNSNLWRLQDIENGIPFVRPENREQFVPQYLNMDLVDAISFSKGCYPGQEVVARMKYRGKTKHRTYRLSGDCREVPNPGDPVHLSENPDTRPCGRIVDARIPAEGGPCQMLASLRTADATRPLCTQYPDGTALKLLTLPYPLPEGA